MLKSVFEAQKEIAGLFNKSKDLHLELNRYVGQGFVSVDDTSAKYLDTLAENDKELRAISEDIRKKVDKFISSTEKLKLGGEESSQNQFGNVSPLQF